MVLVLVLVLNLVVLLTSLQDANLDRRRGELTRSAHPDAPHLARRGEPTPNTLSVDSSLILRIIAKPLMPVERGEKSYQVLRESELERLGRGWWTEASCILDGGCIAGYCTLVRAHASSGCYARIDGSIVSSQCRQSLLWVANRRQNALSAVHTPARRLLNRLSATQPSSSVKSLYICNLLNDFDLIWRDGACWSPAPDVKFKFLICLQSYVTDHRHLPNRKTV